MQRHLIAHAVPAPGCSCGAQSRAASSCQLFPEPTHRTFGLNNRGAKQFCSDGVDQVICRVDFLHPHAERRNAAHPPVRAGCFLDRPDEAQLTECLGFETVFTCVYKDICSQCCGSLERRSPLAEAQQALPCSGRPAH